MTFSVWTFSRPSRFISATAHCDRAVELRRAAEAVADRVGQHGQPLPGERVAGRLADQPRGRLAIRVEPGGRAVGAQARCRARRSDQQDDDDQQDARPIAATASRRMPIVWLRARVLVRAAARDDRLRLRREVLARIDEPIALEAVLLVVQLPVAPALREQLVVRAALDDLAALRAPESDRRSESSTAGAR